LDILQNRDKPADKIWQAWLVQIMKLKWCIGILLLATALAGAQTNNPNNLTALLQQGLLEEQANRNLDAAIADYQALAQRFDEDRQLAATGVFRLGECYRAQGRTNEAAAQYQRVLHDFSDQPTLVTLSRQDLTGMGFSSPEKAAGGAEPQVQAAENSDLKLWNKVKDLPRNELERVLPTLVPDGMLESLLKQRSESQARLAQIQTDYATSNIVYVREKTLLDVINRQTDEKITGMMEGLKLRAELAANTPAAGTADAAAVSAPAASDEDREIQRIQEMIQSSPDLINAPSDGATPLVKAADQGWFKVAAYLLDHGANVNVACFNTPGAGVTPLVAAVTAGNKAMVKFLIERGADINFKGQNGNTPLHFAAQQGFPAVTEVLLASHADVNAQNSSGATPLFAAVQSGQLKIVQMILAAGANVNLKDGQGHTVLNYAIGGSPEILRALLEVGINPNTEDSDGRTPLSYAVERGSAPVVELLLADKADPNGGKLDAPLLGAIEKQDTNSAQLLLQAGANPNAKGKVDWSVFIYGARYDGGFSNSVTPLYFAITEGELPMVKLLLKYKADPNDSQIEGRPLLFSAFANRNILEALLDAGANIELRDEATSIDGARPGWPPLVAAADRQNVGAVEILLKHGANPNARDATGNGVLLHWAASSFGAELTDQNLRIAELLLDHGADPNVRNPDGITPLDLAKRRLQESADVNRMPGMPALRRFGASGSKTTPEQKQQVEKLIALLHRHGALDKLPDWDRITFSRPANNYSVMIFQKSTNDWNRFTLLELLNRVYHNLNSFVSVSSAAFPDLAHITIVRPSTNAAVSRRIAVDLLDATNQLDCSRDVPLEFGDVVEVPEREHSLAEGTWYLTGDQDSAIVNHFRSRAGEAKLIVAGGQTVQLPLQPFYSQIGQVLSGGSARAALTSNSDLSRVKVTRPDPKTNKTYEWIVDCRDLNNEATTTLWLRAGDVMEVPEKP
jgi:ankyrin repeat protein